jgi:hypothetical protein
MRSVLDEIQAVTGLADRTGRCQQRDLALRLATASGGSLNMAATTEFANKADEPKDKAKRLPGSFSTTRNWKIRARATR